jgi:hypothetical protein
MCILYRKNNNNYLVKLKVLSVSVNWRLALRKLKEYWILSTLLTFLFIDLFSLFFRWVIFNEWWIWLENLIKYLMPIVLKSEVWVPSRSNNNVDWKIYTSRMQLTNAWQIKNIFIHFCSKLFFFVISWFFFGYDLPLTKKTRNFIKFPLNKITSIRRNH